MLARVKGGRRRSAAVGVAVALTALTGCGDEDRNDRSPATPAWTVQQAKSITTIRGMPVRVRHCRGRGKAVRDARGAARYSRFECLAGARAVDDPYDFDTVAVIYELRPTGAHVGARSAHRLVDVHFVGGPGVP